ncbi:hypothetical protein SARC_02796 [Sphaeroforma arctica JP610]|uniref:Retrotransposon gag domain-containing protein n=1 Tax=Sphaeroforma arctica JP610 TaxID=667725 RepID=A0A0L0G7J3_9EUKA|nr:hypothetical protein SARC_02796 [Sphaeroforma arctica JP610]KNC85007.1 hypothetical protein SARC_02796 [Sphaeroforma arctica JP610]|eukprot:XP_014158909.1 hypothetical protein SARC_02796 [Sphaeroforma arctica JP610]
MEQMFAAERVAAGRDVEEAVKLQYASTFLSGRALSWYRENAGRFNTWGDMSAGLQTIFLAPNWENDCREKIIVVHQVGLMRVYTERFQELLLNVPRIADEVKVTIFIRGLKDQLKMEVRLKHEISRASTLDSMYKRTLKQYANYKRTLNSTRNL